MISTKQKRIIALLVIAITLVNLGAVATVLYKLRQVEKFHESGLVENLEGNSSSNPASAFMIREIGFDKAQQSLICVSRQDLRKEVSPILGELRQLNADLVDEVMQQEPDTLLLETLCEEIGRFHALMKLETTRHLLDIKKIASPGQNEKLKSFYREMLNVGDEPRSDGIGRRHRRGWRNGRSQ